MDVPEVTVGGFSLPGLLLAFSLIATFLFTVYWLWDCKYTGSSTDEGEMQHLPPENNSMGRRPERTKHTVVPLYAFELEPGTVVLQSADGEIFRILREYDSVGRTGSGSPPSYATVSTAPPANDYHYVPSYTKAHYQNSPTAPDWDSCNGRDNRTVPNPQHSCDDTFGNEGPWAPINIRHQH